MNTSKISIKKVNKHGEGTSIYLNNRERAHIGVRKLEQIIIDMSIPHILRIMSIDQWKNIYKGYEDELREP